MSAALSVYCPYGHQQNQVSKVSMLGFNGERQDSLSGTYLLGNGYRAYSPALRRFLAPDSWSPFGKGGVNAYGYCAGDSISNVDPDGHVVFNRIRRHPAIPRADAPPPQTAQQLNRTLNRQRLQTGNNSHSDPLTPTPNIQQPRANRNPLANGGRMPFEDRRNPSVTLGEVVTLASELQKAELSLARVPQDLKYVNDPEMRADYLADLATIRREVPKQQDRVNTAMVGWFHS
ncbi:RHS repeat-associated core domain-containing protein [Pseudomonas putida]|uniref:RHS repeat-associated core domain-containing protein n=1 Tax=Pseudomonas putida TaxID=303 RepID=UPI003C6DDA9B